MGILAFVVVGAGFFALAASGGDDGGGTQKTEAAGKQSLFERRVARHCGDDRSFVEGGVPHLPAPEPGATGRFIAFGGTLHGYDEIGTDTRTSSAITAEKEANIVFVYCTASDGTRVIPMDCQWQDRHGNVTQTSKVLLNRRAFSLYEARSGALLAEGSFEANVPDRCPHSAIGNESSTADPSVDVGIAEQEKAWMDAHLGTGVYVP